MSRQSKHTEEADAYDQAADEAGAKGDTDTAEMFRSMAVGERVEAEQARRNEGRTTGRG